MTELISETSRSALNLQLGHEKYNSHLYLYIAGFLKNKGFNNLGKLFLDQYDEESQHALIIFNLLTDLNAPIIIPEIDEVNIPINSILDIAQQFMNREILTTTSLDELKKLAIDEDNPVVEEKMREMIKIQQKEYEEANDFMDKSQLMGNDWFKVLIWDLGIK